MSQSISSSFWSWLKQEKTISFSAPVKGSTWRWRHWAQTSFIMHCIGELIEPMPMCRGERYGARTPWRARATAAIMRSEPMAINRSTSERRMGALPRAPEP